MRKIKWLFSLLSLLITFNVAAQTKSLHQLQQEFVDLRLGLFVHFGLPTFQEADWTDPDLSPEVFNPVKLDCNRPHEVCLFLGKTPCRILHVGYKDYRL